MTETMTSEESFGLTPTVLVRTRTTAEAIETEVVTVPGPPGESALLVFRGAEDARAFQRTTGKYTTKEGFELVGSRGEASELLEGLLDMHGLAWVVVPEPWTGKESSSSHLFEREDFMELLASSRVN